MFRISRIVTAALIGLFIAGTANAGNIIEDWSKVKAPPAPKLEAISVSAKDTALIIMDIQSTSCVAKRRPRCVATLAPIKDLLARARAKDMFVVHTFTSSASVDKILPEVAPKQGEPAFSSTVNKFHGSDLDKMLKDRGIKNVIIVGTSAEGAVMGTLMGGAVLGYKMIVPVDGMSSGDLYAEQYVAYSTLKSPATRGKAVLTKIDMIEIK
ncbi:MAG TPA: isochorismatase family protein [Candidatus Binatia bacterium]|jgi:nicotinamidase-related amidase